MRCIPNTITDYPGTAQEIDEGKRVSRAKNFGYRPPVKLTYPSNGGTATIWVPSVDDVPQALRDIRRTHRDVTVTVTTYG